MSDGAQHIGRHKSTGSQRVHSGASRPQSTDLLIPSLHSQPRHGERGATAPGTPKAQVTQRSASWSNGGLPGHRKRMWEELLHRGVDALTDCELLGLKPSPSG